MTRQRVVSRDEWTTARVALLADRSQLLVYHFMFDPGWSDGCKRCSFWADNFMELHSRHHAKQMANR